MRWAEKFAACAAAKDGKGAAAIPPATFQAMLHTWAALHGFTCLEAYGHLQWLTAEARDELFAGQIRLVALCAGLPEPKAD